MHRKTVIRGIGAALLSAAVVPPVPAALAGDDEGFVLRRDPAKAAPFVLEPEPVTPEDGPDWGGAALGAGGGVILLASLGAGVARVRRRGQEPNEGATGF